MKTQNEKLLEQYFNEVFKPHVVYPPPHVVNAFGDHDPKQMAFKDLNIQERESLANSYGYQAWQLGRAKDGFVEAIGQFADEMAKVVKSVGRLGKEIKLNQ